MRKHKCLLIAFILVLTACNTDDDFKINDNQLNLERIEVEKGVLSFSSKDLLNKTVENLKEISDSEKEDKLNQYYEKGFMPLYPHFSENDTERLLEFSARKKSRTKKILSFNPQARTILGEIDEDGEYVEEFDDDLISDDEFAAILNDEREVIIGDTLYKYTYSGMFSIQKDKKTILDDYITENNIEYLIVDPNTITRGETTLTEEITVATPTISEIEDPENCLAETQMQREISEFYVFDSCSSGDTWEGEVQAAVLVQQQLIIHKV